MLDDERAVVGEVDIRARDEERRRVGRRPETAGEAEEAGGARAAREERPAIHTVPVGPACLLSAGRQRRNVLTKDLLRVSRAGGGYRPRFADDGDAAI
ncbi:hypothetical protein, partial [Halarchaeum acidiphilum]|uniref:hypothetical protein n=1 Tax=Halarchaeum acidiphilum TaxID=489138 RepID=UPI0011D1F28E